MRCQQNFQMLHSTKVLYTISPFELAPWSVKGESQQWHHISIYIYITGTRNWLGYCTTVRIVLKLSVVVLFSPFPPFCMSRKERLKMWTLSIFCVWIKAQSGSTKIYDCETRIRHKDVVQTKIAVEYVSCMYLLQSRQNGFPVPQGVRKCRWEWL